MATDATKGSTGRVIVSLAAAVVIIAGLRAAQSIIIPVLIALFLAILGAGPVGWLRRHRIPTVIAVLAVVALMAGVLTAVGAVLGGSVNGFIETIPRFQENLNALRENLGRWAESAPFRVALPKLADVLDPGAVMTFLGTGLKGLVATLSNAFLVLLTLVFMLFEGVSLGDKLRLAFGDERVDMARVHRATHQVEQYLAIKTALGLTTGVLIGVWVAILGLDFALVWGLLAFLLNYIPNIGSIIAAVPAVLLALVQLSPGRALAVVIGYVVVNTVIGNVVEPQWLGRRLGLSTLVVFLSLVFWGWVWGPVGMLLSVPLTMIVKISLENSSELRWVAVLLDSESNLARSGPPPAAPPEPRGEA